MKRLLSVLLPFLFAAFPLTAQESDGSVKTAAKGWYNLTQLSFVIGEENESSPAKSNMIPSVVNINGYRVSEHLSVGLGVGMTSFSYPVFPVFADLRITFFKGNLSPVLAFKGGYSIAKSSKEIFPDNYYGDYKNTGGGMFNPELGFKITMNERADFMLTLGYYYQHLKTGVKNNDYNGYYGYSLGHERVSDINRLSFTIGFLFK